MSFCKICNKEFNNRQQISSHMKIHRNEKINSECPICNEKLHMHQYQIENHIIRCKITSMALRCKKCNKGFRSKKNYNNHIDNCDSIKIKCCCKICGKEFNNNHQLISHMNSHSKEKLDFKCQICNKKLHLHQYQFDGHIIQCKNKMSYFKCEKCDKEYESPRAYKKHIENCTGIEIKQNIFICEICSREFNSRIGLNNHVQMKHEGKIRKSKIYECKCEICSREFNNKRSLNSHIQMSHNNSNTINIKRNFQCPICNEFLFMNKGNFNRHIKYHDKNHVKNIGDKISATKQIFFADPEKSKLYLEGLSQRSKHKHTQETKDKISNSVKKYMNSLSGEEYSKVVMNFINAPLRGNTAGHKNKYEPTKIEKMIINLKISNLIYNGNLKTSKVIKFENTNYRKSSVPDFYYEGTNKIVEVFGSYWHPIEDEELYLNSCAENNYEILILWEEELHNDFENCKQKLYKFLNIKEES